MPEVVSPGYARCLAGYLRAHAAMLEADAAGNEDERQACLEDRWQWQMAMSLVPPTVTVEGRHG